jgi:hypothetical protein
VPHDNTPTTLEDACRATVGDLRAALIDLYDSVGADPAAPQDVARDLKLNKTLTWGIARVLQAADNLAAVSYVPGSPSIERVIDAASKRGAPLEAQHRVRDAARRFGEMIEVHAGDRATLDLIMDGLGQNGEIALEQSRKSAFLGNSGVYGVQAKTNLMSCVIAPNRDDPDQLDLAMLRGYQRIRRLRPSVKIPVFRVRQWSDAGQAIGNAEWSPLSAGAHDPFLRDFGRGAIPELQPVRAEGGWDYVLQPGPIGNGGAFDCYFADKLIAGASRWRTDADHTGEFGTTISIPAARVVFDIIAHKDVQFALDASVHVYAFNFVSTPAHGNWDEDSRLPIRQPVVPLVGSPPAVATPMVPRYAEMAQLMYKSLGHDGEGFMGVRFELEYPPMGSTVVLRFNLPSAQDQGGRAVPRHPAR